jgi:hypothetical protein
MAEQRFCKPQVGGSIPLASSINKVILMLHKLKGNGKGTGFSFEL